MTLSQSSGRVAMLLTAGQQGYSGSTRGTEEQVHVDPITRLPGLLDTLKLMDAALMQNLYHDQLLLYRDVYIDHRQVSVKCVHARCRRHSDSGSVSTVDS